jgi:RHS repeat-associated protein
MRRASPPPSPTLDGNPLPASQTDSLGRTTRFDYASTPVGPRISRITLAGGTFWTFSHNAQGRQESATNFRGQTITQQYDANGRVIRRDLPDGSYYEFAYDPQSQLPGTITRHAGGPAEVTSITYNGDRQPLRVTFPDGRYIDYQYDASGRRAELATSEGHVVRYAYNALGRLEAIRDGADVEVGGFGYTSAGRLQHRTLGALIDAELQFDANGAPAGVTYETGGAPIAGFQYVCGADGRVAQKITDEGTTLYEYDLLGQLTRVTLPDSRVLEYTYDSEGNRIQAKDNGVATVSGVDHLNRITNAGPEIFAHDADGNLIARSGGSAAATYSYDAEGRMIGLARGADLWSFEYDAFENLRAVVRNGVRTEFLTDPVTNQIVSETTGGSTVRYFHADRLVAREDTGSGRAFYLPDGEGHIAKLVDPAGAVLNTYGYLPFGETTVGVEQRPNRFRYAGSLGMLDHGTGLLQTTARHYDPVLGRFLSRDPLFLPAINTYPYCHNQPIGWVDVDGFEGIPGLGEGLSTPRQNLMGTGIGLGLLSKVATGLGGAVDAAQASFTQNAQAYSRLTAPGNPNVMPVANGSGLARAGKILGAAGQVVSIASAWTQYAENSRPLADRIRAGDTGASLELQKNFFKAVGKTAGVFIPYVGPLTGMALDVFDDQTYKAALKYRTNEAMKGLHEEDLFSPQALWRLKNGSKIPNFGSFDPNEIEGPDGFGPEVWIDDEGLMHFTVRFENLATATASAYRVGITLPLDAGLDWSTFALGRFAFAGASLTAPPGRQNYLARTDVATDPNPVKVLANLNAGTGVVTWLMESFDAFTGDLPEDPLAGFLPPNNAAREGEGFVTFTIRPKAGVANPFEIAAQASIVFDTNAAIDTNTHQNRIETGRPTSNIVALPAVSQAGVSGFLVQWAGNGSFSGFGKFDVYVSDNGGPFSIWQQGTSNTSAFFPGVAGHTYGFAVIATDNVGQIESAKTGADAETYVNTPPEAGPDQISRHPTQSVKVLIPTLLSNDSDSDGGTPAFVSVGPGTANGGTVSRSGNWVFYQPPSGGNLTLPDAFAYTINDGQGGVATGAVTVLIANDEGLTLNIISIAIQPDERVRIEFVGIPGRAYRVEWSETLAPSGWQNANGTPVEISPGRFEFFDTPSPSAGAGFYRAVYP